MKCENEHCVRNWPRCLFAVNAPSPIVRSDASVKLCHCSWLAGVFTNCVRESRLLFRIGHSVNVFVVNAEPTA